MDSRCWARRICSLKVLLFSIGAGRAGRTGKTGSRTRNIDDPNADSVARLRRFFALWANNHPVRIASTISNALILITGWGRKVTKKFRGRAQLMKRWPALIRTNPDEGFISA